MGAINRAWHEAHPMPRNATLAQRLEWHLAHAANCACREIPPKLLADARERGLIQ
jgi:hypothetical protein